MQNQIVERYVPPHGLDIATWKLGINRQQTGKSGTMRHRINKCRLAHLSEGPLLNPYLPQWVL